MVKRLVIFFLISVSILTYFHFRIWPTYPILNFLTNTYNILITPYKNKKVEENNNNLQQCFNSQKNKDKILFKTLIIGHAYGRSEENNKGLYPKLLDFLKKENNFYDLIVLNGDIVRNPSLKNYSIAINQITKFTKKLFIVPGNHDVGIDLNNKRREVYNTFFSKNKNFFIYKKNLFFSLDTNYGISILKKDYIHLKKLIQKNKNIENLYIFSHHIPWRNHISNKIIVPKVKKESVAFQKDKKNLISTKEFMKYLKKIQFNKFLISGGSTNDWSILCDNQPKSSLTILSSGVGEKINSLITIDFTARQSYMGYKFFK